MLDRIALLLVEISRRFAPAVVVVGFLVTLGLGGLAATRLGMDSDVQKLLSDKEPWQQKVAAFDRAFPQFGNLLAVVVDGDTPDAAEDGAAALAARLSSHRELFRSVRRPDADPFFRREGLLFLETKDVAAVTAQVIEAQPFIGSLAADPSLRGLFGTLNLALEGVARGDASFSRVEKPLSTIADTITDTLAGKARPFSWQSLLTGQAPRVEELRRFVLLQPNRSFDELTSADDAITVVRQTIHDLGLTGARGVRARVTGAVAIENDELATLASGAGFSLELSVGLVGLVLFLALRSFRLILPIVITLAVGLVATAGFATVAVGFLNPISVAFAVLFIGLGVDFSIQFTVRYRHERHQATDHVKALRHTAVGIAGGLFLAAVTTAIGFFAFLPTSYIGVAQLGLIAGVGMLIAVFLNFTLLPALLTLFRPGGEPEDIGFAGAAPLDALLIRHRRTVLAVAALIAVIGLALAPMLRFDFNPMNLRDAGTESIAAALDLMSNPDTTPFTAEMLAATVPEAAALADRLGALPEVSRALSISSFIPEAQDEKLALIQDAAMLLGPTLSPTAVASPPDDATVRRTLVQSVERLRALSGEPTAQRLAGLLEQALGRPDATLTLLADTLVAGLPARLDALREVLTAEPVTLASLPDSLRRDWMAPDGRARVQATPKHDIGEEGALAAFVAAVRAIAPQAVGPAVTTRESALTIIRAFLEAGIISLVVIFALLWLVLRRVLDVVRVLGPLLLSSLMTVITSVVLGPDLNFANVIALPLLLGIGVAFNIYFVMNWRNGLDGPLQSSTARAVVFSALTTMVAFGSLALSNHPGTASMGVLLTISLGFTLLNTLVTLPALLGCKPSVTEGLHRAPEL